MTYVYHREKAARIRRARGVSGFYPTADVARHIRILRRSGWNNTQIATKAGVSLTTIRSIARGATPTVQYRTAVAVLALKATDAPTRVPGRRAA
jgi:hypothetical protein